MQSVRQRDRQTDSCTDRKTDRCMGASIHTCIVCSWTDRHTDAVDTASHPQQQHCMYTRTLSYTHTHTLHAHTLTHTLFRICSDIISTFRTYMFFFFPFFHGRLQTIHLFFSSTHLLLHRRLQTAGAGLGQARFCIIRDSGHVWRQPNDSAALQH